MDANYQYSAAIDPDDSVYHYEPRLILSNSGNEAQRCLQTALKARFRQDWPNVLHWAKAGLSLRSVHVQTRAKLYCVQSEALLRDQQPGEAVAAAEKGLELKDEIHAQICADLYRVQSEALLCDQQPGEAVAAAEKGLELKDEIHAQTCADLYCVQSDALRLDQKPGEAVAAAEKGVELKDEIDAQACADLYCVQSEALLRDQQPGEAVAAAEKGLELKDEIDAQACAKLYCVQSGALRLDQKPGEAVAAAEKGLELKDEIHAQTCADLYRVQSEALLCDQQPGEAVAAAEKGLELKDEIHAQACANLYYVQSEALRFDQKPGEAVAAAEKGLELKDEIDAQACADLYCVQSGALRLDQQPGEAVAAAEKGLELKDEIHAQACANLYYVQSEALRFDQKLGEAVAAAEKGLELKDEIHAQTCADLYRVQSDALRLDQKPGEAVAAAEKGLELKDEIDAQACAKLYCVQSGALRLDQQPGEAVAAAEKGLELKDEIHAQACANLYYVQSEALRFDQKPGEAVAAAEKGLELKDEIDAQACAKLYCVQSGALRLDQKPGEAVAAAEKGLELKDEIHAQACANLYYVQSEALRFDQKLGEAVAAAEKGLELKDEIHAQTCADLYRVQSEALLCDQKPGEAVAAAEKGLELKDKIDAQACANLYCVQSEALLRDQQPGEAVAAAEKGLELKDEIDAQACAKLYCVQSGALRLDQQPGEAVAAAEKGLELIPHQAGLHGAGLYARVFLSFAGPDGLTVSDAVLRWTRSLTGEAGERLVAWGRWTWEITQTLRHFGDTPEPLTACRRLNDTQFAELTIHLRWIFEHLQLSPTPDASASDWRRRTLALSRGLGRVLTALINDPGLDRAQGVLDDFRTLGCEVAEALRDRQKTFWNDVQSDTHTIETTHPEASSHQPDGGHDARPTPGSVVPGHANSDVTQALLGLVYDLHWLDAALDETGTISGDALVDLARGWLAKARDQTDRALMLPALEGMLYAQACALEVENLDDAARHAIHDEIHDLLELLPAYQLLHGPMEQAADTLPDDLQAMGLRSLDETRLLLAEDEVYLRLHRFAPRGKNKDIHTAPEPALLAMRITRDGATHVRLCHAPTIPPDAKTPHAPSRDALGQVDAWLKDWEQAAHLKSPQARTFDTRRQEQLWILLGELCFDDALLTDDSGMAAVSPGDDNTMRQDEPVESTTWPDDLSGRRLRLAPPLGWMHANWWAVRVGDQALADRVASLTITPLASLRAPTPAPGTLAPGSAPNPAMGLVVRAGEFAFADLVVGTGEQALQPRLALVAEAVGRTLDPKNDQHQLTHDNQALLSQQAEPDHFCEQIFERVAGYGHVHLLGHLEWPVPASGMEYFDAGEKRLAAGGMENSAGDVVGETGGVIAGEADDCGGGGRLNYGVLIDALVRRPQRLGVGRLVLENCGAARVHGRLGEPFAGLAILLLASGVSEVLAPGRLVFPDTAANRKLLAEVYAELGRGSSLSIAVCRAVSERVGQDGWDAVPGYLPLGVLG